LTCVTANKCEPQYRDIATSLIDKTKPRTAQTSMKMPSLSMPVQAAVNCFQSLQETTLTVMILVGHMLTAIILLVGYFGLTLHCCVTTETTI